MGCSSEAFIKQLPVSIIKAFLLIDPDNREKILSVSCLAASILGANEKESLGTQQSVHALLFTTTFMSGPQLSTWSAVPQFSPQSAPIQKLQSLSG